MLFVMALKTKFAWGSFVSDQKSNLNAILYITLLWYYSCLVEADESPSSFTAMYATELLEHYSSSTASSMIRCAMKCIASSEGSCIGYQYQGGNDCLFYNTSVYGHLSVFWSFNAMVIHAYTIADCQQAFEKGITESGVYPLAPDSNTEFDAWCHFDDSHGWTVFQRRLDGSVDFFKYWTDYKEGFGDINGEYWLGNDKIHALTQTNRKLSIYLMRQDGDEGTANYSTFYINNESDDYRLTISGFSGDVDDSMTDGMGHNLNGYQFSTRDRGNNTRCAKERTGAWWYWSCTWANLNGVYTSSGGSWGNIMWYSESTAFDSMIRATMRVTRD